MPGMVEEAIRRSLRFKSAVAYSSCLFDGNVDSEADRWRREGTFAIEKLKSFANAAEELGEALKTMADVLRRLIFDGKAAFGTFNEEKAKWDADSSDWEERLEMTYAMVSACANRCDELTRQEQELQNNIDRRGSELADCQKQCDQVTSKMADAEKDLEEVSAKKDATITAQDERERRLNEREVEATKREEENTK